MKKPDWLFILSGPALFTVILQFSSSGLLTPEIWQVLALAAWMISWWVTEAIPIPVTALLPMVLLPFLGVFTIGEATAPYASPIIFLFMGGFIIAIALEKHNLHLRIALSLIKITGTSGNGIILGFMLATALLSMWISNTATAVMMLPVAASVITLLQGQSSGTDARQKRFALGLMLTIAYSANIGGTMTLIGTPPNIVMVGFLKQILGYEMSFSQWILMAVPIGILLLMACYFLITKVLFPNNLHAIEGSEILVHQKLKELGRVSREEKLVLVIFVLTAVGWIFKSQIHQLIGNEILSDTAIAMTGGILMFVTPTAFKGADFLLKWEDTAKLPWGILILFGGGMCLAQGLEKVGIIQLVGETVSSYQGINPLLLTLIITGMVIFMTELMSNVALIAIFLPVVIGIAQGLGIDPLILVMPATLAASCAFMMPISTPPNAIVFASGHIKIKEMMRAGIWLNIVAIMILVMATNWLVKLIFL